MREEENDDGSYITLVGTEAHFKQWYDIYDDIFFDPLDRMTEEDIYLQWKGENARAKLFFIKDELHEYSDPELKKKFGKNIGILMACVDRRIPSFAYVPYGGLHEDARGYSKHHRNHKEYALEAFENYLRDEGVKVIFVDCEDPDRSYNLVQAYQEKRPDKKVTEKVVANYCYARLIFFARRGYSFVFDQGVKYCRPSSGDSEKTIQDYDVLGFKVIAEKGLDDPYIRNQFDLKKASVDQYLTGVRNEEKKREVDVSLTAMSEVSYRSFYTILQTLDLCEDTGVWNNNFIKYIDSFPWLQEWSLRRRFLAMKTFYTRIHADKRTRFLAFNVTSLARRGRPEFDVANTEMTEILYVPGGLVKWRIIRKVGKSAKNRIMTMMMKVIAVVALGGVIYLATGERLPEWLVDFEGYMIKFIEGLMYGG